MDVFVSRSWERVRCNIAFLLRIGRRIGKQWGQLVIACHRYFNGSFPL